MDAVDAVVIGAGANGLACALVLARNGLAVRVIEDRSIAGGVCRTEFPFARAPRLGTTSGIHRAGYVPREIARLLDVEVPVSRDTPASFVPTTTPGRFLLAASDNRSIRDAASALSPADARAVFAMHDELDELTADLEAAWFAPQLSHEAVAERFVRPAKRSAFLSLCRASLGEYVDRFGVGNELLKAWIAADVLSGTFGSWSTKGGAGPLLVRHAARCSQALGDDASVSALMRALSQAVEKSGIVVETGRTASRILVEGNAAACVVLDDGTEVRADTIVCSADPFRLRALVGTERLAGEYVRKIEGFARPASMSKINVALSGLPRFSCLPEDRAQHAAAILLLPGERPLEALEAAFSQAAAGALPEAPPIECILPSVRDSRLGDPEGRHSLSLLVPWAPYDLSGTTWAAEEERWLTKILSIVDEFAPGTKALVVDATVMHPKKLETHFGVTRGQLRHVDDILMFGDRLPYTTPIGGLYACGAGCGPAGDVFAVAGYNAAKLVLADLELGLERTEVGRKPLDD